MAYTFGREIDRDVALKFEEIQGLFRPVEGLNTVYYGKVRNGKTRNATADILELLRQGEIVYANWVIDWDGFDQREHFSYALMKFLSRRQDFFKFSKENFHFFSPDEIDVQFLGRLVNVHIFIDEGQWVFNSHVRDKQDDAEAIARRKLILHGGHYCRSLNVITQRPSNIFKDVRSQINIWYRCQKRFDFGNFMIFQRWAIEDMKDDLPVEFDKEGKPLGQLKTYWVNKKHDPVFKAYNTHAMRAKDAIEMVPEFEVYETSTWDRLRHLASFANPWRRRAGAVAPAAAQGAKPLGSAFSVDNSVDIRIVDKSKKIRLGALN